MKAIDPALTSEQVRNILRDTGWTDSPDPKVFRYVNALEAVPFEAGRPSCVIAHTVKGKGVSFMEDRLLWHYRSPDPEELRQALQELEVTP